MSCLSTRTESDLGVCPPSNSSTCSEAPIDPYMALCESEGLSGRLGILFGWWPQSGDWNLRELVQCSTRCLPAVRPHRDLVALPSLPEVRDLWACWSREHLLGSHQVIWFQPCLGDDAVKDPAAEVCEEVLLLLASRREALQQQLLLDGFCFYPLCIPTGALSKVVRSGLHVIGKADLPLRHSKTWRHPHISGARDPKAPSFRELLPPDLGNVRCLRGYVADDAEDLRKAWAQLRQDCPPGTRFVLKPLGVSTSCGVITDVQESDVHAFNFEGHGTLAFSVILEEMVASSVLPGVLRTLDMVGGTPCECPGEEEVAALPSCCALASRRINEFWGLHGPWSLDFAADAAGAEVIVGISIGCPSESFAMRLWASQKMYGMAVSIGKWVAPCQGLPAIEDVVTSLRSAELLWNGDEGVVVYQHFSSAPSAFAVASSFGIGAVDALTAKLSEHMQKIFGIAA